MHEFTVSVNKATLLGRIKENRDKHKSLFNEAVEGYRAQVIKELETRLEKIRQGKLVDVFIRLPVPEDHTPDYDRVIDMLEMDTRTEIEMPEHMFAEYVRDDWAWKRAFIETASNYAASLNRG